MQLDTQIWRTVYLILTLQNWKSPFLNSFAAICMQTRQLAYAWVKSLMFFNVIYYFFNVLIIFCLNFCSNFSELIYRCESFVFVFVLPDTLNQKGGRGGREKEEKEWQKKNSFELDKWTFRPTITFNERKYI